MKTSFLLIFIVLTLISTQLVSGKCTRPIYSQDINETLRLCGENFGIKNGLIVSKDNIDIDCSSAVLQGNLFGKATGFLIEDRKNVTLHDCRIVNYDVGIVIRNSSNIVFDKITLLRNRAGIKLFNSFNVSITNSFDISLEKPLLVSNSSGNIFSYFNKKIKGDFCSYNFCGK